MGKRRETSKSHAKQQADPVKILEESAVLLGLPKNDWHSLTTTIKRLVRVVEQHVPKLEGFITDVCQEMEQLESSLQQSSSSSSSPSKDMKDSSLCYDDSESTTTATTVTTATTIASTKNEEEGEEKQRNHNKRKKSERKERMANA